MTNNQYSCNIRVPRQHETRNRSMVRPLSRGTGRSYRLICSLPVLCLLFAVLALLPPCVLACPCPLSTTQDGTVSGGVYVGAAGRFSDGARMDQKYSLPA
jgi:hypothetical protein